MMQTDGISIHAPHTGRDNNSIHLINSYKKFQSTRPIRGATPRQQEICPEQEDFNPRAPYGARQPERLAHPPEKTFQSTRPIRGATSAFSRLMACFTYFNPRAPYGARPEFFINIKGLRKISIHAPHTGRDHPHKADNDIRPNFNPRAPYGARQQKCIIYVLHFCNNRQSKHKNQRETSSVRTFF